MFYTLFFQNLSTLSCRPGIPFLDSFLCTYAVKNLDFLFWWIFSIKIFKPIGSLNSNQDFYFFYIYFITLWKYTNNILKQNKIRIYVETKVER